jgi:hypothetical protein
MKFILAVESAISRKLSAHTRCVSEVCPGSLKPQPIVSHNITSGAKIVATSKFHRVVLSVPPCLIALLKANGVPLLAPCRMATKLRPSCSSRIALARFDGTFQTSKQKLRTSGLRLSKACLMSRETITIGASNGHSADL